jgi:hypothetical protein
MTVVQPLYFAPILQYVVIVQCDELVFECDDHYQKQTHRNRCYINTSAGRHALSIPTIHQKGIKQKTRDTRIDHSYSWIRQHIKTLETAYMNAPFYEFYIPEITGLLEQKHQFLLDLALDTHHLVSSFLEFEKDLTRTEHYLMDDTLQDYRNLANAKSQKKTGLEPYYQLFQHANFMDNLSVLDLLFMEGPAASLYLNRQSLPNR